MKTIHKVEEIYIESGHGSPSISYSKDIKHRFLWMNKLLSRNECKELISLAESFGFENIKDNLNQYECFFTSKLLVDHVWNKIHKFNLFLKNLVQRGTNEIWSPYGIDELIQISKYEKGHFSEKQVFELEKKKDNHVSIIIYLNDDYDGGKINFYDKIGDKTPFQFRKPKMSSALFFTDELIYNDDELTENSKYIMRLNIKFKEFAVEYYNPKFSCESIEYQAVEDFMKNSFSFEKQEDVDKSVESYFTDLKLLKPSKTQSNLPFILDIFLEIFSHFDAKEVIQTFRVSKEWSLYARNHQIWYRFYKSKFETLPFDSRKDWYFLYAKRSLSQNEILIMNLGTEMVSVAFSNDKNYLEDPYTHPCFWDFKKLFVSLRNSRWDYETVYDITYSKSHEYNRIYDKNGITNDDSKIIFFEMVHDAMNLKTKKRIKHNVMPLVFIDDNNSKEFRMSILETLEECPTVSFVNIGLCIINYHQLEEGYVFYQDQNDIYYDIIKDNNFLERKKVNGDLKEFVLSSKNVTNFIFCDFKEKYEKDQDMLKFGRIIDSSTQYSIVGASKLYNISHNLFGFQDSHLVFKYHHGPAFESFRKNSFSLIFKENLITQKIEFEKFIQNAYNIFGKTPLHIAAQFSDYYSFDKLILNGSDFNLKEKKSGQSVLHIAILNHEPKTVLSFKIIKYCVEKLKMDINQQDNLGCTPLHYAYWKDYQKVVNYLEEHNPLVLPNFKGQYPQDLKRKYFNPHPIYKYQQWDMHQKIIISNTTI